MTLPTRHDKDYLTITPVWTGFCIRALKQHADELQALFNQHGLPWQRDVHRGLREDVLWFDASADRGQVERVLGSYKLAKGS